jgi:hypothetical protein
MLYKDRPSDQPPSPEPSAPPAAPSPSRAEEMARQLRAAVRGRSRRWRKGRRITLLIGVVLLAGLLAWWFWPRVQPARVHVIAFDQLAVPDQETTMRIATEPVDPRAEFWGEQEVFAQELKPLQAAKESLNIVTVRTDHMGLGTFTRTFSATPLYALMVVRYEDKRSQPPWHASSQGRVFVWPARTPLLVVELTPEVKSAERWEAMTAALEQARALGWKVAYLAAEPDRPLKYQEWRNWALGQLGEDAPVLGRLKYYDGSSAQQARAEVLAALKQQFQGRLVHVEATAKALNVQVIGADNAGAPAPIKSWQDLLPVLQQK